MEFVVHQPLCFNRWIPGNLKVKNIDQLYKAIVALIQEFNVVQQAERLQAFHIQTITQSEIDQSTESELISTYKQIFIARSSRKLASPEYQQMTIVLQAIRKALYRFKMRVCFKM